MEGDDDDDNTASTAAESTTDQESATGAESTVTDTSTSTTATATSTSTGAPVCGNGVVEAGEQCDDGNSLGNDSCLNNCQLPRCGDGIVQPIVSEECDDGDQDDANGCNTQCGRDRYVFLTSESYQGNFGEVSGANSLCKKAAMIAGLPNYKKYRAWMSDDTFSPATWFFRSKGRYILTTGVVVADDWNDLTDGTLQHPINIDENGNERSGQVWSNTTPAGLLHPESEDCMAWKTTEFPVVGRVGNPFHTDFRWTDDDEYNPVLCGGNQPFYCFEN
jgi:cysteine-rich repeat protein